MKQHLLASVLFFVAAITAADDRPSREAFDHCAWEKLSVKTLGLEAWLQSCDYGSHKIDFIVDDRGIAMRDSRAPSDPMRVIEVIDLRPGESAKNGLRRIFNARTDAKIAKRCVLAPHDVAPARADVQRFSFVPDKAYRKELDAMPYEGIPDPACGELGDQPEFIQYFEVQRGARKVLLVITGQDTPLFDEETLHVLQTR